jgi:hypothetical protein
MIRGTYVYKSPSDDRRSGRICVRRCQTAPPHIQVINGLPEREGFFVSLLTPPPKKLPLSAAALVIAALSVASWIVLCGAVLVVSLWWP